MKLEHAWGTQGGGGYAFQAQEYGLSQGFVMKCNRRIATRLTPGYAILLGLMSALQALALTNPPPVLKIDEQGINQNLRERTSFAPVIKKVSPSVVNIYSTVILRERQFRGPTSPGATPTIVVLRVRRYRCQPCGAVLTVVPRETATGRLYTLSAIAWALALFGVTRVRRENHRHGSAHRCGGAQDRSERVARHHYHGQ